MLQEHFTMILSYFTVWKIGADKHIAKTKSYTGRPRKNAVDGEDSDPIKGFPTVLSHKVIPQECDWCEGTCVNQKQYKRSIGSNIWQAKCQDCGLKREIPTGEINKTK